MTKQWVNMGMIKFLLICSFMGFLQGCNTPEVSSVITQNTIKEVVEVKKVIKQIEQKTPIECKTDLFLSQLQTLNTQTDSIKSQIENISLACESEKDLLRKEIRVRELIISIFLLILSVLLFFRLRVTK